MFIFLDLCMSSYRRGHAHLPCILPGREATFHLTHRSKIDGDKKRQTNSHRCNQHMNDKENIFCNFDGCVPSDEQCMWRQMHPRWWKKSWTMSHTWSRRWNNRKNDHSSNHRASQKFSTAPFDSKFNFLEFRGVGMRFYGTPFSTTKMSTVRATEPDRSFDGTVR